MKLGQVVLVLSLIALSYAATLANSGYPTYATNAQRNWKSNRPLLCSDVSNGKTTILRQSWVFDGSANGFSFSSNREITVDDQGFMYITGPFPETPNTVRLHVNGTFFPTPTYIPSFQDSVPTHVQGGEYYLGGSADSTRVSSSNMTQIAFFSDTTIGEGVSSYVPFGNNLMVKTNQGALYTDNAFTYFSIGSNAEYSTGTQIQVGSPQLNVIVYNNSGIDIAIAVGDTGNGWKVGSTAWAPVLLDRSVAYAFVSGNELILLCNSIGMDSGAIYRFNAANGQLLATHNFTAYQGQPFYPSSISTIMYQNGKSLAGVIIGESSLIFVDVINQVEYGTTNKFLFAQPISSSDNVVLLPVTNNGAPVEFIGYDWDSRDVKVRGRLPVVYNSQSAGSPFITDNCNVHVAIDQQVYTLAPMPLQNIVPILECVDADGYGYFAYNNLEQLPTWIPQTVDRNNLTVVNVAPFEDFAVGRSAYFPLSQKILLGNNGTFTWVLEDYTLTFTIGPALACPTTVNVKIVLTADSPFPVGFKETVRVTFVNVTGISDSRVTVVNAKRDVTQTNTLETELAIAPDNTNTEPSPQQVVSNFVTNQDQFVAAINSTTDAPSNLGVASIAGKSVDTEQQGVLPPPVAAPIPVPVDPPMTVTQPQAVPIAPTSSASLINISFLAIVSFIWSVTTQ